MNPSFSYLLKVSIRFIIAVIKVAIDVISCIKSLACIPFFFFFLFATFITSLQLYYTTRTIQNQCFLLFFIKFSNISLKKANIFSFFWSFNLNIKDGISPNFSIILSLYFSIITLNIFS